MAVGEAEATTAREMVWWGWGTPEGHAPLSPATAALLEGALGIGGQGRPVDPDAPPRPGASRLAAGDLEALAAISGGAHVDGSDAARLAHTRGKSTPDLLKVRAGDLRDAPDAVVSPASHAEVLALLALCAARRIAVVPFGGGTSVVGGLTPQLGDDAAGEGATADGAPASGAGRFAGVVALDLRRIDALVAVDRVSMTATFGPGVRGPAAEALLAAQGLTLGHFPQSFEHASLGGFAATRSSGQASAGYGRFDAMVVALTVATPTGEWRLGRGPANAAGPDLRQLVLGSEGAFGVITELTVTVREAPAVRRYEGWHVGDFAAGTALLRDLAQHGALPTIARLSDEVETFAGLANARSAGEATAEGGCYVLLGFEGSAEEVAARRALVAGRAEAAGAVALGGELGDAWLEGRFHGPYLRDALLDAGGLVETLETTASWAELPAVYAGVREAAVAALGEGDAAAGVEGAPAIVLCHVSHVYRSGASLYFTVVTRQAADPLAQWDRAKRAAMDAIVAAGGSITHHHAVGRDHRPWLGDEIGEAGVRVLAAVKRELDPAGVLNPGVLVAPPWA